MSENKITITPIALKNQKPTDIKECFIELFDDYIHYKVEFYASEPNDENDHDLGWEEQVYNNFETIALKKNIAGIEKSFTKDKKWGVYVMVDGFSGDIKCYFRSIVPANTLFNKLQEWLLK
jgi:hypothetical protein